MDNTQPEVIIRNPVDFYQKQEMGEIVYDPANKLLYDSFATLYGWDKSLYDGYHYEYLTHPMRTDTDNDGLDDKQELEAGSSPFIFDMPFFGEAVAGFVLGDIGLSDPEHDNMAYLGGSIASGLVPVVEWIGTVRDVIANSWHGEWTTAGITLGTGLISALPATVVADEVPEMAAKLVKFVKAYPEKITDVARYILKSIPNHSMRLLDEIYDGAVEILRKSYGLSDEVILKYADEGIDIGKLQKAADDLIVEHGMVLSKKTTGKIVKFDEPIKEIRFAGAGGEGADIITTLKDGRTIGREVTTISKGTETNEKFTRKVGNIIYEESQQVTSHNIREIHIQINIGTDFANNANLKKVMDEFPINYLGDLSAEIPIEKVALYDVSGSIIGTWTK